MNTSRFINLATGAAVIAFILIVLTPVGEPIMRIIHQRIQP